MRPPLQRPAPGTQGQGSYSVTKTGKPMPYRCRKCRRYFSVKVGSCMQSSNLGCQKWGIAIYMITTSLKGRDDPYRTVVSEEGMGIEQQRNRSWAAQYLRAEFWSGRVIQGQDRSHPDGAWQDAAWQQAALHESTKKLRILGRHLTKSGWFEAPAEPPWKLRTEHEPAIVLFYSFKGGVGRSTALAATALHLASNGDRVVVLDADLDAPGVASMLAGHGGATAPWGR